MLGSNELERQLRRLQVYFDYCNNTTPELETLNLVAQRNIPVTFTNPAAAVINDTLEPAVEPRIMKAIPVHAQESRGHQDSGKQETGPSASKSRAATAPAAKAKRRQHRK